MPSSRLNKEAINAYRNMLAEAGFDEQDVSLIVRASMFNAKNSNRGTITMQARDDGQPAEIYLYGEIGFNPWDEDNITLAGFAQQLRGFGDVEDIDLHINSPGGGVFEGVAIGNLLTQHKARVTVYIDGLAGSIASVIAMSGDEIYIAENAAVMIHNASGMAVGDHREMLEMAAILEKLDGQIARTYAARTGRKDATFRALMAKETWFTGQEAVDAKLATKVMPAKKAAALAEFDLSGYRNAPDGWRDASEVVSDLCGKVDVTMQQQVTTRLRLLELDAQEAV